MKRDLERIAKDCGKVWTNSEVVFFVYDTVREIPLSVAVAHLQSTLSSAALAAIQQAALRVVQEMDPDAESFGIGWVTPHAPVEFEQLPMDFVRHVSVSLVPASNA
jgi:hypothetical protein